MPGKMTNRQDIAKEVTLRLLAEWFGGDGAPPVAVRLWDGDVWPGEEPAAATLVLKHPGAKEQSGLPLTRADWYSGRRNEALATPTND